MNIFENFSTNIEMFIADELLLWWMSLWIVDNVKVEF